MRDDGPLFERCAFVAVTSPDLARAREFWVTILGCAVVREEPTYLMVDVGGVRVCFDLPDEGRPRSPGSDPVIGLKVHDLLAALAVLEARGVRPCKTGSNDGAGAWAEVRDPDGRAVILTERPWPGSFARPCALPSE